MPHPWERQEYDTPTSYTRFRDYYLPQHEPRSLDEAWRLYSRIERGLEADRGAPGSWRAWHQARDYKDRKIEGAMTWPERAIAWDDHMASLRWARRQKKLTEYEDKALEVVGAGIDRVLEMLAFPLEEEVIIEETVDGKKTVTVRKPVRWDYNAISRVLPSLDKLARMIAGQATERIETVGDQARPQIPYETLPDEEINDRIAQLMARHGKEPADPDAAAPGGQESPPDPEN